MTAPGLSGGRLQLARTRALQLDPAATGEVSLQRSRPASLCQASRCPLRVARQRRVSVQRPQSPPRFGVLTKDSQNSGSVPHSGSRFSEVPVSDATRWEGRALERPARSPACPLLGEPHDSSSFSQERRVTTHRVPPTGKLIPGSASRVSAGVRQVDTVDLSLKHLPRSSQCGGPGPPAIAL